MSPEWTVEFFEDDQGRQPAREWLQSLDARKHAAAIAGIETLLTTFGLDVCSTEHGKHLGQGLFEFRIRHDEDVIRGKGGESRQSGDGPRDRSRAPILLRIFCHAHGNRIVLLLGGYDKGADSGKRRQNAEIETARRRLRSFQLRIERRKAGDRRRAG
jgi:hypothetical protein